ncbi:hypothetical protein NMY22_g16539 [Coprinellus aureogranulatus]|nr:hypothetical protein NMY22_g16539 [Coprinellus aureogranulatus]
MHHTFPQQTLVIPTLSSLPRTHPNLSTPGPPPRRTLPPQNPSTLHIPPSPPIGCVLPGTEYAVTPNHSAASSPGRGVLGGYGANESQSRFRDNEKKKGGKTCHSGGVFTLLSPFPLTFPSPLRSQICLSIRSPPFLHSPHTLTYLPTLDLVAVAVGEYDAISSPSFLPLTTSSSTLFTTAIDTVLDDPKTSRARWGTSARVLRRRRQA